MILLSLTAGLFAEAALAATASPVFRFFNTRTSTHFYTISAAERDSVLAQYPWFTFEGTAFYAQTTPDATTSPVYRFFNTQTSTHFYTINEDEKNYVLTHYPQFVFEGPVYYAPTATGNGETQLMRFFNTQTGAHFYTTSTAERDHVIATWPQFIYEGPVYWVYTTSTPSNGSGNSPPKTTLAVDQTMVTAPANVNLTATATDTDGTVTRVDFYASSALIGTVTSAPYSLSYFISTAGSYTFTAVATDNSGATGVSNAVGVTANGGGGGGGSQPPKISLASSATQVTVPGSVMLTATASSPNASGSITQVIFYQGATMLGQVSSAPYTFTFNATTAGTYAFTAVAIDNLGATTTSNAVGLTATSGGGGGNQPPKITLGADATGLAVPGILTLNATATDDVGVASVTYYQNGALIGQKTSAPYTYPVNLMNPGVYSYYAVATDNMGLTTTSNTITVNAYAGGGGGGNQPPKVTLSASNTSVAVGTPVTLTANATDADGTVASVTFYNGATAVGTVSAAPYTYNFPAAAAGTYVFTAVATDNLGATGASNPVTITVGGGGGGGNQPPKATLAASATNVTAPATVTLTATATDSDGTVVSVAIYNGATLLATLTTAPYVYNYAANTAGTFTFTAVATDNLGATGTSNPVTVTVSGGGGGGNQPPKVTLSASSTSVTVPATVTLTAVATAQNAGGSIASVKFFQGANLLGTVTTAPYTQNFSANAAGTFTFTAVATDNLGLTTTSNTVTVTASAGGGGGTVPKITLAVSSYLINTPASVTLTGNNVSSANGAITRVSFFMDGAKLTDVTTPPYTFNVNLASPGTHTFYAEAADVTGAIKDTLTQTVMGTAPAATSAISADTYRFLNQATFGFTQAEAARVSGMGMSAWIDDQINNQPMSGYPNSRYNTILLKSVPATCSTTDAAGNNYPGDSPQAICARDQLTLAMMQRDLFTNALYAPDQLRQRVAWALGQILVTSGNQTNLSFAYVMSRYQSLFFNNAFGNFETLLNQVTLSPAMGDYLTMANNDRSAGNRQPNQNYAREIMQLFSVGLNELNMDGSTINDATGMPVPTYGQADIAQFANVFTGWTYPTQGSPGVAATKKNPPYYEFPMVTYPTTANTGHETASKTLLNGTVLPANQTPQQDITDAVHNVFMHPNTAPFISRELIQRLVTGNPSPAYIQRIANVFANDGTGTRGNLGAVVKAILLDPEARGNPADPTTFGTLREPVLAVTAMLRSLGANTDGNRLAAAASGLGQNPLFSPTVFNYYLPDNVIDGTMIVAPEFQLHNTNTAVLRANLVFTLTYNGYPVDTTIPGSAGTKVNTAQFDSLAANPAQLVDAVNKVMTGGQLPASALATITTAVTAVPVAQASARSQMAVYLIASSYFYQVQF